MTNVYKSIFTTIAAGVDRGLPAPLQVYVSARNRGITIDLPSATDVDGWLRVMDGAGASLNCGQPYPLKYPTMESQWLSSTTFTWGEGWHVYLTATDPITPEQLKRWEETHYPKV